MKEKIHPKYEIITVKCACGNVFQTRSTRGSFTVDICAACHPFYTGQQKMIDAAGKIEKFRRKYAKFQQKQKAEARKKEKAPEPEPAEPAPAAPAPAEEKKD
jgi:large subunit ribosomal protein L31